MDAFVAVADPTRRQIIESLSLGEQSFGAVADQFHISRPAVSQHLKVLREAGLVSVRRDAQRRIYALNKDGLVAIDNWIERVTGFWNESLDRLESQLNAPQSKESNNE